MTSNRDTAPACEPSDRKHADNLWPEGALDADELVEHAMAMHARGFNCAQCVACALAPKLAADEDLCFRATEGFGGGMGGFSETCGAVSGGALMMGLVRSTGMDEPTSKAKTYRLSRELVQRFRDQNGSTLCADLKGVVTGKPLRSCDGCIEDALRISVDILNGLRANA